MKRSLFLLCIPFLLLGCSNNDVTYIPYVDPGEGGEGGDPIDPVDPTDPADPTDPTDPTDPVDPEEEYALTAIKLNYHSYDILKTKSSYAVIVEQYVANRELTDEEKEVSWKSTDTSVFTTNDYGKIVPVGLGSAYLVCESKYSHVQDRCLVNVVNSMDDLYTFEYQKVTDFDSLSDKDTIIFADPKTGKVATNNTQGSYLHVVSGTFSSDGSVLESFDEDEVETFYLGEEDKGFTLQARDGKYFVGFNEKRVGFVNNRGNKHWQFTLYEGNLYIETYNDVRGWLMFNKDLNNKNGGFTLYEREEPNEYVYMPTVYRLTKVNK